MKNHICSKVFAQQLWPQKPQPLSVFCFEQVCACARVWAQWVMCLFMVNVSVSERVRTKNNGLQTSDLPLFLVCLATALFNQKKQTSA